MTKTEFQFESGSTSFHAWSVTCDEPRAHVMLVHGLGEHSGRYHALVDYLIRSRIEVASFDLRGHGHSNGRRGDGSLEQLLDDLELFEREVAQRLAPTPRFAYGHSFGGLLVLLWVLQRTPRCVGAIASAPALRTTTPPPKLKVLVGRMLRPILPRFTMSNGLDRGGITRDSTSRDRYRDDPLVHRRISVRLGLDVLEAGERLMRRTAPSPLPIFLMHGDADRLTSCEASRRFAANVTGCELQVWPGLYHELHHEPEQAAIFAAAVDWMERVGGLDRRPPRGAAPSP